MSILCPVEVGFHRCYDRDLTTHLSPTFPSSSLRRVGKSDGTIYRPRRRRLDAFHINISYTNIGLLGSIPCKSPNGLSVFVCIKPRISLRKRL